MKTLILHVGLHKTGTTFLQKALRDNRALLLQHDIDLASGFDPHRGNHHRLTRTLRKDGRPDDILSAIEETHASAVIISSETLMPWLLASKDRTFEFANELKTSCNLRIVIFLRRQDFLKESIFAEVVCKWFLGSILDEDHYQYDFGTTLGLLENLFGRNAIGISVYRDDTENDLLKEFLRCAEIGIDPGEFSLPEPQRVSLTRRKVLALTQLDKRHHTARTVVESVRQCHAIADDGQKFLMSPAQRRDFLARFVASNRLITQHFNLDCGDYLYDLESIPEDWVPPQPIAPEEWAQLLLRVADDATSLERLRRARRNATAPDQE